MAGVYGVARLCFSAEELGLAQTLASSPRMQNAILAAHLFLTVGSSRSAKEVVAAEGTLEALLPFTEAFTNAGYIAEPIDLAPNPKLITVICNNLLPAVAGELINAGLSESALTSKMLVAGIRAAIRRGVFSVTIGMFQDLDDAAGAVSLSGFSKRICPAVGSFGAFCEQWLPYFFRRFEHRG